MRHIEIAGRRIGPGCTTYIVAEISSNHNQSYENAADMVRAAKDAGADAVKLQTATPEEITLDSDRPEFRVSGGTLWDGETLYHLYQKAQTPWEWQPRLKTLANDLGLQCFSSPFSARAVDFLREMDVPAYKVASFELVDIPLIEYIARQGKPIIMSTGASTRTEIEDAVLAARAAGAKQIALLKCNSAYPAPPEEMNLRTIPDMARAFRVPVGLSDHTTGIEVPVAAVAVGACIVEKHFTLSRKIPSPDAKFSLEPQELSEMVRAIRIVERALGQPSYEPTPSESSSRIFRRSLFVVENMKAGDVFTEQNVRSIRPGHGLPPRRLREILGKRATRDIPRGTPLTEALVAER